MRFDRCFGCMEEIPQYPCPHCGYDPEENRPPDYILRQGTILNGKYVVGKMLGQGGFGITYVGWDLSLARKVAIKEYFPAGQVTRHPAMGSTLQWYTTGQADNARRGGMEMFLKEARKMTRVDNVAQVVRVLSLFQENDTAYIVMEFVEGETLKNRLMRTGPMEWGEAKGIFLPVIRAMGEVHGAGLIHRDLSPDNLMLEPGGGVRILDLGAAKDLNVNSGASSMLVAKGGFSPLEQYTERGGSGTWTDVYALAATMYYTLTGTMPPPAVDRMQKDTIRWDLPRLLSLPKNVLTALHQALIVAPGKRTQTMEALESQLTASSAPIAVPWKKLIPAAALAAAVVAAAVVGLRGTSRSTAGSSGPVAPIQAQDWAAVDAQMAAGTRDVYTYRGGAKMELYFDDSDREVGRIYTNAEGDREFIFKARYSDSGDLLEELSYDGDENLMRRELFTYHGEGQMKKSSLYDGAGKLLETCEVFYDNQNRETGWIRRGGDGTEKASGETTYEASGESQELCKYDDGESRLYRYDADRRIQEFHVTDPKGNTSYSSTYHHDSSGTLTEVLCYNDDGDMTSKTEYQYSGGKTVRTTTHLYLSSGEKIYVSSTLFGPRDVVFGNKESSDTVRYYENVRSIQGNITLYSFSSAADNSKEGSVTTYNWDGEQTHSITYDSSGRITRESLTHFDEAGRKTGSTDNSYYENGHGISEYNADGDMITYKSYDEDGRLDYESETHFDENGEKTGSTSIGYWDDSRYVTESDAEGRELWSKSFDTDGTLVSEKISHFNDAGEITGYTSTYYYDKNGSSVTEFDASHNRLRSTNYNADGTLSGEEVFHYSKDGERTGSTDTLYHSDGSKTVTEYDANYNRRSRKRYDAKGNLVSSQ